MEKRHTHLPNSLVGVYASQESEGALGLVGGILASPRTKHCLSWEESSCSPLHCTQGCSRPCSSTGLRVGPQMTTGPCPGAEHACESPEQADWCSSSLFHWRSHLRKRRKALAYSGVSQVWSTHVSGDGKAPEHGLGWRHAQVILQKTCLSLG